MKRIILLFHLLFIGCMLSAQSVSVTGPSNLGCPPVTGTYTFDVDEQWCTSFMTGVITLGSTADSEAVIQNLPLNGLPPGSGQAPGQFNSGGSFDMDVTFNAPGVYYLCIEVTFVSTSIFCGAPIFSSGNDVKVRKACKRIVVGDSPSVPIVQTRRYCQGETFSWCPGNFGIQTLNFPFGFGQNQTVNPLTGCISFTVNGGDENDEFVFTVSTSVETCDGFQTGTMTFIFGGCDGHMEFDDSEAKGRNAEAAKQLQERISIYPNPSEGIVSIRGVEDKFDVEVFSISGQLFLSKKEIIETDKVDINELPSGSYIMMIKVGDQVVQKKLQKI